MEGSDSIPDELKRVLFNSRELARKYKIAVIVVHHTGKVIGMGTGNDVRGAKVLWDGCNHAIKCISSTEIQIEKQKKLKCGQTITIQRFNQTIGTIGKDVISDVAVGLPIADLVAMTGKQVNEPIKDKLCFQLASLFSNKTPMMMITILEKAMELLGKSDSQIYKLKDAAIGYGLLRETGRNKALIQTEHFTEISKQK